MLRRAIARGLAADARKFANTTNLALPFRDGRVFAVGLPLNSNVFYRRAIATPHKALSSVRSYATAKSSSKKSSSKSKKPGTPKKAAKKKPAAKKKASTRQKKPQTELEKKRALVRDLKKQALSPPKPLPTNRFAVFIAERAAKGTNAAQQLPEIGANYRSLPQHENERLSNIAQQNNAGNKRQLKAFVEQHTPDEIRLANNARKRLNKIAKDPLPQGAKRSLIGKRLPILEDDRAPHRPPGPFTGFLLDRWSSPDYENLPNREKMILAGTEWKTLTPDEANKYHAMASTNRARYDEEYDRIFTTRRRKVKA